ncbi:MAG: DUF6326 family protein [Sedimentitalea sp.]|uniref:DUF6326 family protein n=1 Tax=Sedimentitalea sp. TaxID=2048915 RepID=UPI003266B306
MNASQRDQRVFLTVLWIFNVLNFFARDIHELGPPGMPEQMMSGVIGGIKITEALMLLGGAMIEIPILMAVLALALPRRINRWTNACACLLTAAMIIAANLNPDLDNLIFMIIQLIALVIITCVAWCWSEDQLPDVSARFR